MSSAMSLIWNRLRLLMVLLLPIASMLISGCPGPGATVFGACGTCADCNPTQAFAGGVVEIGTTKHTLFSAGGVEYGCIGVTWEGQGTDVIGYIAKLKSDGTYEVFDPSTRQFAADGIAATVAPGVGQIDALFFVMKVANEQEALGLNCADVVKGKVNGCFALENCLFAWQVKGAPVAGNGGTCSLCRREVCNGKDDDCNDANGDGSSCGYLFSQTQPVNCTAIATETAPTDGCSPTGTCACVITPTNKVFVCAGKTAADAKWVPIETVTSQCNDVSQTSGSPKYFCAGQEMVCDSCPNGTVGWKRTGGCEAGQLIYSQ